MRTCKGKIATKDHGEVGERLGGQGMWGWWKRKKPYNCYVRRPTSPRTAHGGPGDALGVWGMRNEDRTYAKANEEWNG